jgi:Protein of unknown function (DUF3168)
MYPPVYATCAADTGVATLLTDPDGRLRLFPFGEAPQSYPRPYAVWQIVYGGPDNSLSCIPNTDLFGVQIDVYAPTADEARSVASAIRAAIEATIQALVVRYNGESKEAGAGQSRVYRYSFDVDWRVYRA